MTTETTGVVIQGDTVALAQAMARAHGHTWGGTPLPPGPLSPAEIEAETFRLGCEGPCGWGITAPAVDENGMIVHTTGSGRLEWTIGEEAVFLTFSRPEGPFLAVTIDRYTPESGIAVAMGVHSGVAIFARHVEEAMAVIAATASRAAAVWGLSRPTDDQIWEDLVAATDPIREDEVGFALAEARHWARRVTSLLDWHARQSDE